MYWGSATPLAGRGLPPSTDTGPTGPLAAASGPGGQARTGCPSRRRAEGPLAGGVLPAPATATPARPLAAARGPTGQG